MSFAFARPAISALGITSTIVDAARSWRIARDTGQAVQPALYTRLETWGCGVLAPVLDGLLSLFEAGFRRRFHAGALSDSRLTNDEHHLLDLLESDEPAPPIEQFHPDLAGPMRIAVRSSRIMLGSVIGRGNDDDPSSPASRPIFFGGAIANDAPQTPASHAR